VRSGNHAAPSITKRGIFDHIYALLHHPECRERYATNLCRELPRISFATQTSCHPEAAESLAKRETPNEGSMQPAGVEKTSNPAHFSPGRGDTYNPGRNGVNQTKNNSTLPKAVAAEHRSQCPLRVATKSTYPIRRIQSQTSVVN
jgi:hypothetical protein